MLGAQEVLREVLLTFAWSFNQDRKSQHNLNAKKNSTHLLSTIVAPHLNAVNPQRYQVMEQRNYQTNTVNVPTEVLQTLLAEIANLRKESSETKKLLTSIQEKLNTILKSIYPPPARGEFDVFPRLPIELRDKIWDTALSIPGIVAVSLPARDTNEEYKTLTPTTPSCPLLFVNKESRARAKKILVCLTEKEPQLRVPLL